LLPFSSKKNEICDHGRNQSGLRATGLSSLAALINTHQPAVTSSVPGIPGARRHGVQHTFWSRETNVLEQSDISLNSLIFHGRYIPCCPAQLHAREIFLSLNTVRCQCNWFYFHSAG